MTQWKIEELQQATNTAIAAAASEQVIANTQRVDSYNALTIINGDAVEIVIYLDNDTTRPIKVLPKTAGVLAPEEGRKFHQVVQLNNDAAAAETAGAILFIVSKQTPAGE